MKFTHVFLGLIITSSSGFAADDFNWLRDDARKDERVLTYLTEQNHKTEQHQKKLSDVDKKPTNAVGYHGGRQR